MEFLVLVQFSFGRRGSFVSTNMSKYDRMGKNIFDFFDNIYTM